MNIRPRNNQILVQPDPLELRQGVIHIPEPAAESALNRPDAREATVLAVGPGKWAKVKKGEPERRIPIPCKAGDKVLINAWMTDVLKPSDKQNDPQAPLLVNWDDVYGIVHEPETT